MSATRALVRGGLLVSGSYFIANVLGFVRVAVITASVGERAADTFFAAFSLPDLLFQLVAAGALGSALVPTIATLLASGQDIRAARVVSAVANTMLLALVALAGIGAISAPVIVPLFMPGFSGAQLESGIELTRIMLLAPIFLGLGAVATSMLNARGRFAASVLAPITYNVAIIVGVVLLVPRLGPLGLAVSVVLGSMSHLAVQLPAILGVVGFRYVPTLGLSEPETRRTMVLLIPRAIGLGGAQIQLAVARAIGSTLIPGSITAFTLGFTVFQVPIGVLAVPLGIVALPTLSTLVATGRTDEFVGLIRRSLGMLVFAMVPIAAIGAVAAGPAIRVLFGHGSTSPETLDLTARTLAAFLFALPSEAAIVVLARAFYAMRDTRTPVAAALVAVVVSIGTSLIVVPILGAPGLAIGIATASAVETSILVARLSRRVPSLRVAELVLGMARFIVPGFVAAMSAWIALAGFDVFIAARTGILPNVLVSVTQLALAGLVGGPLYVLAAQLMRVPEGYAIIRTVRSALARRAAA